MIERPIDEIDEAVLASLITNEVSERRDLEFKRDIPGGSDNDTKEFLADITSLANAQGGDLLFGVDEANGVAVGLPGINASDVDREILRLESMVRDGIEPRLYGMRIQWVKLTAGTGCIVIRVPASFAAPHRVRFKGSSRFYSRNSRGKYEMDVHELRIAFTQADQLPQRFRDLHRNAVANARGMDMPFSINPDPTAVTSIIPLNLFREQRDLSILLRDAQMPVRPSGSIDGMITLEGGLMYTPVTDGNTVRSYALSHRSGRVDVCWTVGGTGEDRRGEPEHLVWPESFEGGLIDAAGSAQARLKGYGLEGPWVVLVTIYGALGFKLVLSNHFASKPAWRDGAELPQLVIEHIDENSLMPIFQSFWRIFGDERPI